MTKVDFYILPGNSINERHLFACRLAEKAFKLGNQIYIHSDDNAQAHSLDKLLWSWRNSSFLPHQMETDNDNNIIQGAQPNTIQIGYGNANGTAAEFNGLLINLSHSVPDFFSRFERVSEIVVQVPTVTETTRANYRFYRDRGYQLKNHDLRK